MSARYDGGPAFPRPHSHDTSPGESRFARQAQGGMSLRAYVAAQVVAQLAPHIVFPQSVEDQLHAAGVKTEDFESYTAHVAVGFADALIAELAKEPTP